MLQSGSLPVTFNTLSQSQVSATLGKDSLRQALIAGIIGLLVVMIYLVVFYRLLGRRRRPRAAHLRGASSTA